MEADQTGERIKIVNEYKTATGQPLTGSQPFGFMNAYDETTGRKKVVKDPDEAPILEDALHHFMTYQSKRKTVTYLYSKHHISTTYDAFSKLLKNTMLYGAYRDNPQYCEAYIDKETFDKIQEIANRNCRENTAENRHYMFTGLLRCPCCGRTLSSGMITTKQPNDRVYKYKCYRCPNNRERASCDFNKALMENSIEKLLLKNIEQYVEDAKIRSVEVSKGDGKPLKYDIKEINAEIERLNYSWQKGRIKTIEQYDKQYDALLEQLELAEKEQHQTKEADFSNVESVLQSGWEEIYKALDDEHKRAFWRNIIASVEIEWTTEVKRITKVDFL